MDVHIIKYKKKIKDMSTKPMLLCEEHVIKSWDRLGFHFVLMYTPWCNSFSVGCLKHGTVGHLGSGRKIVNQKKAGFILSNY